MTDEISSASLGRIAEGRSAKKRSPKARFGLIARLLVIAVALVAAGGVIVQNLPSPSDTKGRTSSSVEETAPPVRVVPIASAPSGLRVSVDGVEQERADVVVLPDDGRSHIVELSSPAHKVSRRIIGPDVRGPLAVELEPIQ